MRRINVFIALCSVVCSLLVMEITAAKVTITPDVVYGRKAGMGLIYHVYQPDNPNGAAILFMVSGGWYSGWGTPEALQPLFVSMLGEGFTVFAVNHGSAPLFKVPQAVEDVRLAVRHVRANAVRWGIDPDRLGVTGGSAGGHLSLMLGLASDAGNPDAENPLERVSSRVQAVVAYFPPTNLTPMVGPNERFPALDFNPLLGDSVSPILYASPDDPPVLLIHGDQDRLVALDQSTSMEAKLEEANVVNELLIIEGAAHGFRDAHAQQADSARLAWFKTHLGQVIEGE